MNDDLKARETLSAVLDDEANELELARLLKQPLSPELMATMRRYQSVRTVLAGRSQLATFDISARVAAALQDEPLPVSRIDTVATGTGPSTVAAQAALAQPGTASPAARKARWQLLGGVAVAASVAFAVIFSAQSLQPNPSEMPAQLAQAPAVAPVQTYPDTSRATNNGQPLASLASAPVAERPMDEEQAKRLNEYLMRHAEHAARSNGQVVVPYARMAGFEASQAPQR